MKLVSYEIRFSEMLKNIQASYRVVRLSKEALSLLKKLTL